MLWCFVYYLASFILNLIMIISSFKFNIFSLTQIGNSKKIQIAYDLSYMTHHRLYYR